MSVWDEYFIWNKMINLCLKSLKIHSLDFVRGKKSCQWQLKTLSRIYSMNFWVGEAGFKNSVSNQKKTEVDK